MWLKLADPPGIKARDTITALFWPDLDQARARRALRQAIAALRDTCGDGVIVSMGKHRVLVPPGVVKCDVARFRAVAERGHALRALSLYRGEFLAGVRLLNVAEELEEWVFRMRADLAQVAAYAALALVRTNLEESDGFHAYEWARRAVEISNGREDVLRRLMRLCHELRQPDLAGTLYHQHREWLEREGGLAPLPATRSLFAELFGGP